MKRALGAAVMSAALIGLPAATAAQEDSVTVAPAGNCALEWGAPPGGSAPALRHTQDESGEVADYFSGRTLFTCGTATMLADSAVSYETRGEVYLVGNVAYRDSVRSLESSYLTYYEREDLVIARDSVRLVRAGDGSTLEGPYVEFLRAVSGVDELTTALGRPHMTLYPESDAEGGESGPPFDVDADRIVFAGEDEARGYGNVVIDRDDMQGEADSIRLTRADETGWMWGDPWIDAEGVRLEGDVISFRSEEEQLEEIHASGDARAIGESFEVDAELIDVDLENEEPRRVWAHGEGLSRALSGGHGVYGDSLEFAMFESAIDSVYSVGEAVAVQGDESGQDAGPAFADSLLDAGSPDLLAAAVSPDSLAAEDSSLAVSPDSLAAEVSVASPPDSAMVGDPPAAAPQDSLGTGEPPAIAASDSARSGPPPDSLAAVESQELAPDSLVTGQPSKSGEASETETPGEGETGEATPVDDPDGDPEEAQRAALPGEIRPPRLRLDGDATWVTGDTLIAVFERPGADSIETAADEGPLPVAVATTDPAVELPPTLVEGALAAADSAAIAAADPAAADSTPDPVMEHLIVIGNARSFYSQVRDSTETGRRSKNYMIGKRIDVFFENGEPARVIGVEAIGVFLDPEDDPAFAEPDPGPDAAAGLDDVDLSAPGGDSTVVNDSTPTLPDSLAVPPDTTGAPPDTTPPPPDTTRVSRNGVAAVERSVAVRSTREAERDRRMAAWVHEPRRTNGWTE